MTIFCSLNCSFHFSIFLCCLSHDNATFVGFSLTCLVLGFFSNKNGTGAKATAKVKMKFSLVYNMKLVI